MRTPRLIWVSIAVSFFLPALGWGEAIGAKAIFSSGEGPTVKIETPDVRQPPKPKTKVVKKTEPAHNPKQEQYMGLSYWVELVGRDGEQQRVTTDQVFRSGDRIRLNLMSNWDGYLYLVNLGSTGRSQILFPHPAVTGGNNFIKANTLYQLPHGAYIRFDENPGEETILVMLSPTPMAGIAPSLSPQMHALTPDETNRLAMTMQQRGAKDLILEVDASSPKPASYTVARLSTLQSAEQMISLQIKLKHQ